MKYFLLTVFCLLTCTGFSQEYLLADNNSHKNLLANIINDAISENKIKEKPVVVVDGKVLKSKKLDQLNFYSSDIINVNIIEKNDNQMIINYGLQGANGVVMVETSPIGKGGKNSVFSGSVLYILDEEPVTRKELNRIDSKEIKTVEIVQEKNAITTYTEEDFDSVIVITMHKSE